MNEIIDFKTFIAESTTDYPRHSEASILELTNGNLLVVWTRFTKMPDVSMAVNLTEDGLPSNNLESDNQTAAIVSAVSKDGGRTWSEPQVILSQSNGLNVMSPAISRLLSGNVLLLYSDRKSTTEAQRKVMISADDAATWGQPISISSEGYITGRNDSVTILNSGRIIAPLHLTDDWHSHYLYTRVAYSDDEGQTWHFSNHLSLPKVQKSGESGCWEPDVVEMDDGRLLMILRTAMGTLFRAESHDFGVSWENLRSLEVTSPVAPGSIGRINGTPFLYLIWNWNYDLQSAMGGSRSPLCIALSNDNGNSWSWRCRFVIEDDQNHTFAYPSCTQVGDHIYVTYYETVRDSPFGPRSLKLSRISIKKLLDKAGW